MPAASMSCLEALTPTPTWICRSWARSPVTTFTGQLDQVRVHTTAIGVVQPACMCNLVRIPALVPLRGGNGGSAWGPAYKQHVCNAGCVPLPFLCCSGQAAALAGGTTMHIDFALPVDHDLMAGWQAWKVRPTCSTTCHAMHCICHQSAQTHEQCIHHLVDVPHDQGQLFPCTSRYCCFSCCQGNTVSGS